MIFIRFVGKKLEDLLEVVNINFVNKLSGGQYSGHIFCHFAELPGWICRQTHPDQGRNQDEILYLSTFNANACCISKVICRFEARFQQILAKTTEAVDALKNLTTNNSNDTLLDRRQKIFNRISSVFFLSIASCHFDTDRRLRIEAFIYR